MKSFIKAAVYWLVISAVFCLALHLFGAPSWVFTCALVWVILGLMIAQLWAPGIFQEKLKEEGAVIALLGVFGLLSILIIPILSPFGSGEHID
jgi:hypothetical protein